MPSPSTFHRVHSQLSNIQYNPIILPCLSRGTLLSLFSILTCLFSALQFLPSHLSTAAPLHNNACLQMSTPVQHASPQKRIANMASNSPTQPHPRRVLGDVTNSARNSPGKHNAVAKDMGKAAPLGSPLKQNQTMTPAKTLNSKASIFQLPSVSSKKRQFEDIDDADDDADADRRSPYRMMEMGSASKLEVARPPVRLRALLLWNQT